MDRPPQPTRLGTDVVAVNRPEVLAKVLAEHLRTFGGTCKCGWESDSARWQWGLWTAHVAAALDAALAAQEGERGGAEVAAAVKAIHGKIHWCHDSDEQPYVYAPPGTSGRLGDDKWPCPTLAALADPARALATHDAEVLRAAADDPTLGNPRFRSWLRERADHIEAQS